MYHLHLNDSNYLYIADDVSANQNNYTAKALSSFFGIAASVDGDDNLIYYRGLGSTNAATSRGLQPLSGEVIYMENRAPISRASDQTENVKLIIEY